MSMKHLIAAAVCTAALASAPAALGYEAYVTKNVEVHGLDSRNGIGIYIIGAVVLGLKVNVENCERNNCLITWDGKVGWIPEAALSRRAPAVVKN